MIRGVLLAAVAASAPVAAAAASRPPQAISEKTASDKTAAALPETTVRDASRLRSKWKPDDLSRRVQQGIDAIYKMEFDECERVSREMVRDYPDLPYGYYGLAIASWARFEYEQEESNPDLDKEFERRTEAALAKGRAYLKAHPEDAEAHQVVSGIYGLRARLSMVLHRWIRAYLDGSKAIKLAHRALELDPELYDVYTGLGMYDYYTDTLPTVVKILAKVIRMRGNAQRGIERLRMAASRGMHTATAAKLILIEIVQDRASRYYAPEDGLRWIREIRREFPMNPLFHFVEVIYLYEARKPQDARHEAQAFLKGIEEKKTYYHPRYAARGWVGLASAYFLDKDWTKAETALAEGVKLLLAAPGHNRWGLWALVRRGQVRDVRGDRSGALEDYRLALKQHDYWDFHDIAKKHLKQAAVEADLVATPMTPP